MTEKELKNLSRNELLELLLLQTKRTEELEAKLEETERKLSDRMLAVSDAGSIAEAALEINGVFKAAEAAAKLYLDNIKMHSDRCDKMLADTRHRCAEMEKRAQEKVMMLKAEVDKLQLEWKNPEWKEPEWKDPEWRKLQSEDSDSEDPKSEDPLFKKFASEEL